jgi:hypothetical protein
MANMDGDAQGYNIKAVTFVNMKVKELYPNNTGLGNG